MIDFRYHIVSIVAIFIALAVGIVLGSGPLSDNISGFLESRTAQLANEKVQLQDEVSGLKDQLSAAETYAQLTQPAVVQGRLLGSDVVVVSLPGASGDDRSAVEDALKAAGAVVADEVTVKDAWTDPQQADVLARVTEGVTRGPIGSDTYQAASDALAGVLVTSSPRLVGEQDPAVVSTLGAYQTAGFIDVGNVDSVRLASAAVVVTGGSDGVTDQKAAQDSATLIPLVTALDRGSTGAVVVGPPTAADPNGFVTAVRNTDAADTVSTVDSIDTTAGQTVTVLALQEQMQGGVGHYGTGDGAQAVSPDTSGGGG